MHCPHENAGGADTVNGRSGGLPAQQYGKLLVTEFIVFLLVGAAFDGAVYDIAQLVEINFFVKVN